MPQDLESNRWVRRVRSVWRYGALLAVVFGTLTWLLSLDPIRQDTDYHLFADTRSFAGIPNFLNVISNLPFLIVGLLGLRVRRCHGLHAAGAWSVLFFGVALVSGGSAFYHWNPTNESLIWDRVPMAAVFMGLFVALLGEYLDARLTATFPLGCAILVGLASVVYWFLADDLRPYGWVQLMPLLTIPVLMLLFQTSYTHSWLFLLALSFYAGAKIAEFLDEEIFSNTRELLSGHTLKHLLAAACCCTVLLMLRQRTKR